MIHGFGYDTEFTSKKIEGVALFSWDIINPLAIPALVFVISLLNAVISITLQVYPGICQWSLLKGGLVCKRVGGSAVLSSVTCTPAVKEGAGLWAYGWLELPFKPKRSQAAGNDPDYGFGRVHVGFGRGFRSPSPHPQAGSAICISHLPCHTCFSIPKAFCDRHFPSACFATVVSILLESSPTRSWAPRRFREIIPSISVSVLKGLISSWGSQCWTHSGYAYVLLWNGSLYWISTFHTKVLPFFDL